MEDRRVIPEYEYRPPLSIFASCGNHPIGGRPIPLVSFARTRIAIKPQTRSTATPSSARMVTLWSPTLSTRSVGGACARSPSAATWSALASAAPLHTCWWRTRTPPCAARQDARKIVAVSWVRSISITPQSFGDNTKSISGMPVDSNTTGDWKGLQVWKHLQIFVTWVFQTLCYSLSGCFSRSPIYNVL